MPRLPAVWLFLSFLPASLFAQDSTTAARHRAGHWHIGLAIHDNGITIGNAAAPDASLYFLFWGALFVLPVVGAYTAGVYWLFRGKFPAAASSADLHRILVIGGGAAGL